MSITNLFGLPLCRNCWRTYRITSPIQRPFHSSSPWSQEAASNHYDTLGVSHSASAGEIKKYVDIIEYGQGVLLNRYQAVLRSFEKVSSRSESFGQDIIPKIRGSERSIPRPGK